MTAYYSKACLYNGGNGAFSMQKVKLIQKLMIDKVAKHITRCLTGFEIGPVTSLFVMTELKQCLSEKHVCLSCSATSLTGLTSNIFIIIFVNAAQEIFLH